MISEPVNILMTGAGAPGAPGIIHCLKQDKQIQLTIGDADPNATGRFLHQSFFTLPKADDPDFIVKILQVCRDKSIRFVLPLVTKELLPLSQHNKDFLSKGIQVLVSKEESIRIANNKAICYQFLKDRGVRVPTFHVVRNVEAFKDAARSLGFPHKAFCFKPAVSNGSRGIRIVSDSINESDILFNHKPYHLYMSYSHVLEILSANPFPELLVSEFLPGDEFSVDCLALHGKTQLAVPRIRNKMINGISVQGVIVHHQKIIDYCSAIIETVGLHGNIGIQIKLSENEEPLLLEVNPRVQGTIVAALGAGVNLPLLAIYQEMGIVPDAADMDVKWGTQFSRFWTEVFY